MKEGTEREKGKGARCGVGGLERGCEERESNAEIIR